MHFNDRETEAENPSSLASCQLRHGSLHPSVLYSSAAFSARISRSSGWSHLTLQLGVTVASRVLG